MRPIDRPLALFGAVVAASLLGVSPLAAQCVISGPSVLCGGSARLCGPEGNYAAEWIGPNGFSSTESCITVGEPGTYSLFLFDLSSGAGMSCDHTLALATAPTAAITGPGSACAGTTVSLCGPAGDFDYAWTLPGGATAASSCVTPGADGSYSLVVTDRSTGCVSAPANHEFAFTNCDTTPPPPPPTGISIACPRTASFWSAQCRETSKGSRRIARDLMGNVAACVDDHAAVFHWGDAESGFCGALRHGTRPALKARTLRQFAAVLANLCAAEIGLTGADGSPIGVSADRPLTTGGGGTVGEWASQADAQLVALDGRQPNDPGVGDGYRAILRTAWLINHGEAIAPSCPTITRAANLVGRGPGSDDLMVLEPDDRSLTAALGGEASDLRLEKPSPNPFRGQTRVAWSLDTDRPASVRIVIHDLAGRAVRVLADEVQSPGAHELWWDGRGDDGRTLPGGAYFVRATTGGRLIQSRLTLLR
jgi:hypothetical protein